MFFPRKKTQKKYDTSISPCPNCSNICSFNAFMARRSGGSCSHSPPLFAAQNHPRATGDFSPSAGGTTRQCFFFYSHGLPPHPTTKPQRPLFTPTSLPPP